MDLFAFHDATAIGPGPSTEEAHRFADRTFVARFSLDRESTHGLWAIISRLPPSVQENQGIQVVRMFNGRKEIEAEIADPNYSRTRKREAMGEVLIMRQDFLCISVPYQQLYSSTRAIVGASATVLGSMSWRI